MIFGIKILTKQKKKKNLIVDTYNVLYSYPIITRKKHIYNIILYRSFLYYHENIREEELETYDIKVCSVYKVILRRTVKYLHKTAKRLNIIYLSFSLKCITLLLNSWSKMYI